MCVCVREWTMRVCERGRVGSAGVSGSGEGAENSYCVICSACPAWHTDRTVGQRPIFAYFKRFARPVLIKVWQYAQKMRLTSSQHDITAL